MFSDVQGFGWENWEAVGSSGLDSPRAFADGHLLPTDTPVGPQLECLWELSECVACFGTPKSLVAVFQEQISPERGWGDCMEVHNVFIILT